MSGLYEQYRFNVAKGPEYRDADALPAAPPVAPRVKAIAYYLPQFHPIAENDAWWGPGFTEWTNVTKALPRYLGHRQPRLPADLGFYDLRQPDTLRRQAALARRGGIHGFCIHDYWFSGRKVLETPLAVLLANPDIDLPFCLNWANENWTRRWDGSDSDVLLEQRYAPEDDTGYVASILPALRDPRYIRVDGRPLIMVYRPALLPDPKRTMARWRAFLIEQRVGDPYLVMAQTFGEADPRPYGMDAAAGFPPHNALAGARNERSDMRLLDRDFDGQVRSYAALARSALTVRPDGYRLFPGVCPGWDNEARKPGRGHGFYGSTPALYADWLAAAAAFAAAAPRADERVLFVNAWNEWAEGAILEPDRHFGHAYLVETRRVLEELDAPAGARAVASAYEAAGAASEAHLARARPSLRNRLVNAPRRAWGDAVRRLARER